MADQGGGANGPLAGVRVLEFSQLIAGPIGGMHLSDLGADVLKVEPPGGEEIRRRGRAVPGESKAFQSRNRGKRSLVVDLKDPRGRDVIHRLIPGIDVVTINYRLGVAERLGIDYPTLRAIRPDLIYWQNTGFGEDGPEAQRAGSDIVMQAYSGLMAADGKTDEDGAPVAITPAIADIVAGFAGPLGICAALYHRDRTGEGQLVGTSLLRTSLFVQYGTVMREPVEDAVARDPVMAAIARVRAEGGSYDAMLEARRSAGSGGRSAFRLYYGGYRAKDGALVLGANTKAGRDGVRRVLGIEGERSDDPDYDPRAPENVAKAEQWLGVIRERMLTRTVAEWVADFDAAGVAVSPVHLAEEMADDPQALADGVIWPLEHEITGPQRVAGPVLTMSATPTAARKASPALGADTDDVLRACGLDDGEIAALRAAGVVA